MFNVACLAIVQESTMFALEDDLPIETAPTQQSQQQQQPQSVKCSEVPLCKYLQLCCNIISTKQKGKDQELVLDKQPQCTLRPKPPVPQSIQPPKYIQPSQTPSIVEIKYQVVARVILLVAWIVVRVFGSEEESPVKRRAKVKGQDGG